MGTPKTTIELNGKRYDARTGKVIDETPAVTQHHKATPKKPGGVIDGFVKAKELPLAKAAAPKPNSSNSEVRHAPRAVKKSQTLMRSGLKKPVLNQGKTPTSTAPKHSHVNSVREKRAQNIQKSPHISKFGSSATKSVIKKNAHLPVATQGHQTVTAIAQSELHKIEQALHNADTHLHKLEKDAIRRLPLLQRIGFKHKTANVSAMVAALLLLVSFFGYQNAPAIEMRVAATRSGVEAKLPNYKPAGYGVSRGIEVSPGKVSVNFVSRTDDKRFTVTQQASNWNSASLLANHVSRTRCNTCYQTWQNNGKTVYIYDNSNATWVNGGIWYEIKGDASLTSDQLLRLANSF